MPDVDSLVERCRTGDALAWEALVRLHQARVYALACHYLRDPDEARDVAQEVFVRVWQSLPSFDGAAFLPWLLCMARNCAIDHLRRRRARPPAADFNLDDGADLPHPGPGPAEAHAVRVREGLVHRALQQLSEPNREVLMLKDIQGLDLRRISQMLGVPVGTIKSRASRARLELAHRIIALDPSYGDLGEPTGGGCVD